MSGRKSQSGQGNKRKHVNDESNSPKHVLVILDSRENTHTKRKDGNDLLQMWARKLLENGGSLAYQVAVHAMDVGDVQISVSDTPFEVPESRKLLSFLKRIDSMPKGDVTGKAKAKTKRKKKQQIDSPPLDIYGEQTLSFSSANINSGNVAGFFKPSAAVVPPIAAPIPTSDTYPTYDNSHATYDDDPIPMYDPTKAITPVTKAPDTNAYDKEWVPPRPFIMIERKSVSDLNSSYSSGRYRDQKTRLTNCEADWVIYLIEGYRGNAYNGTSKAKATTKKRLLSTFVHTMFRDHMPVYHTPKMQDSFEWIDHLANEIVAGKTSHAPDYLKRTKYTDNIQMTKKANLTPAKGLEVQLATVPNVSARMARAVTRKYASMMELCRAYEALEDVRERELLLEDLTYTGPSGKPRRLASRSKAIYHYVCGNETSDA